MSLLVLILVVLLILAAIFYLGPMLRIPQPILVVLALIVLVVLLVSYAGDADAAPLLR